MVTLVFKNEWIVGGSGVTKSRAGSDGEIVEMGVERHLRDIDKSSLAIFDIIFYFFYYL